MALVAVPKTFFPSLFFFMPHFGAWGLQSVSRLKARLIALLFSFHKEASLLLFQPVQVTIVPVLPWVCVHVF